MTVSVEKSQCMGLGYCWNNCSSVFEQDPVDQLARVKAGQEDSQAACIATSQENCCPGAIIIT